MTDEAGTEGRGGTVFDDPNREAVGVEPAWVEGTGGAPGVFQPITEAPVASQAPPSVDGLDEMTKVDLLELARQRGVSPANNDMTKQELIDGVRAAG